MSTSTQSMRSGRCSSRAERRHRLLRESRTLLLMIILFIHFVVVAVLLGITGATVQSTACVTRICRLSSPVHSLSRVGCFQGGACCAPSHCEDLVNSRARPPSLSRARRRTAGPRLFHNRASVHAARQGTGCPQSDDARSRSPIRGFRDGEAGGASMRIHRGSASPSRAAVSGPTVRSRLRCPGRRLCLEGGGGVRSGRALRGGRSVDGGQRRDSRELMTRSNSSSSVRFLAITRWAWMTVV